MTNLGQRKSGVRTSYEIVTANGHGIHGRTDGPLADAIQIAERVATNATIDFGPVEIQQKITYPDRSMRFFLRAGTRWVSWDISDRSFQTRQPDMWWPCAAAKEAEECLT